MSKDPRQKRRRFPVRYMPTVFKAVVLIAQVMTLVWKMFRHDE